MLELCPFAITSCLYEFDLDDDSLEFALAGVQQYSSRSRQAQDMGLPWPEWPKLPSTGPTAVGQPLNRAPAVPTTRSVPAKQTSPPLIAHKFRLELLVATIYGEDIFITGSSVLLGNWDLRKTRPLSASEYSHEKPLWYIELCVFTERSFEYKFVRRTTDGLWEWEGGSNRRFPLWTPDDLQGRKVIEHEWR